MGEDDVITPGDLGKVCNTPASTVIGWLNRGRLKGDKVVRHWKIKIRDARQFCREHGLKREFEGRYGIAPEQRDLGPAAQEDGHADGTRDSAGHDRGSGAVLCVEGTGRTVPVPEPPATRLGSRADHGDVPASE